MHDPLLCGIAHDWELGPGVGCPGCVRERWLAQRKAVARRMTPAAALNAARRRWRGTPAADRADIRDPSRCALLFHPLELIALAKAGKWPLSSRALARIMATPEEQTARRAAKRERLFLAILDLATKETDDLRDLLWNVLKSRKAGTAA